MSETFGSFVLDLFLPSLVGTLSVDDYEECELFPIINFKNIDYILFSIQ